MPDNLMGYIGLTLFIAWFVAMLVWFLRRQFSPTKAVRATVVSKQISESFSKYSGNGMAKSYHVTFLIDGKRRSFRVSEFSYNGYRKGETGTLKFKGDRLIDFH